MELRYLHQPRSGVWYEAYDNATGHLRSLSSWIDTQAETVKNDMMKLEGPWVRIRCEADGHTTDDSKSSAKPITLVIKGNKFANITFKIDPTKTPKQIDMVNLGPKGKEFTLLGIYELQRNELKLCMPFPFEGKVDQLQKRPTEFKSGQGSNDVVGVYQRQKK